MANLTSNLTAADILEKLNKALTEMQKDTQHSGVTVSSSGVGHYTVRFKPNVEALPDKPARTTETPSGK